MRILMQTLDRQTEQNYLAAADTLNRQRLCVLHSEAQVMERLFRDPFDVWIVDDADRQPGWLSMHAEQKRCSLILLLREPARIGRLPDTVLYGFSRSYEPIEVLRRIDRFPIRKSAAEDAEALLSRALQQIGMPVHLKGFYLLKEALRLLLAIDRPTEIQMEHIYAVVSKAQSMQASAVEHAMRHAIETAWLRADVGTLETAFGNTVRSERAAPSNAEFLFMLTDRIRTQIRGIQI